MKRTNWKKVLGMSLNQYVRKHDDPTKLLTHVARDMANQLGASSDVLEVYLTAKRQGYTNHGIAQATKAGYKRIVDLQNAQAANRGFVNHKEYRKASTAHQIPSFRHVHKRHRQPRNYVDPIDYVSDPVSRAQSEEEQAILEEKMEALSFLEKKILLGRAQGQTTADLERRFSLPRQEIERLYALGVTLLTTNWHLEDN